VLRGISPPSDTAKAAAFGLFPSLFLGPS
jgi:hypothetical protein